MRCNESLECKGNCWLNVAGRFDVWNTVSKYCKGTKEEQCLINDVFHGIRQKEEVLDKYNIKKEDKKIVEDYWGN